MPKKKPSVQPIPAPKKRTARLAEAAFQRLQQAIISRELKQGDTVREQRLAREWNIGRTPMREAVRRAAEFGYLILRPNQAPTVRQLSADDIRQIYSIRELLECHALKEAEPHITDLELKKLRTISDKVDNTTKGRLAAQLSFDMAFHSLWISKSENPWLTQAIDRLVIYRPNLANLLANRRELAERGFDEHKGILEALEARDVRKAVRLLGQHIKNSGNTLAQLTQDPENGQ
jgi:DNA-binding GntR family transcriptional regulator